MNYYQTYEDVFGDSVVLVKWVNKDLWNDYGQQYERQGFKKDFDVLGLTKNYRTRTDYKYQYNTIKEK